MRCLCCVLALLYSFAGTAQPLAVGAASNQYEANWASLDKREVPGWFEDAKFGVFIHWGLYSVPAWGPTDKSLRVGARYAEWYWNRLSLKSEETQGFRDHHLRFYGPGFKYPDFAPQFKAEYFKPTDWAALLQQAGAKYVVLTTKHHEGFTLWPSQYSVNWNAVDVGPHQNIVDSLTGAVRGQGMKMGYYYSLYEWFHPLYKTNVPRYVAEHMLPQMKELVSTYQPDLLWTDGEWEQSDTTWRSTEFLAWLYNESPVGKSIVVNDRWGKTTRGKHGGYYTTEYGKLSDVDAAGMEFSKPWEECRGIGSSFGYNRAEKLEDYSSSEQLVHLLIEKVARGGNLLLNIGPTSDGLIPVVIEQRLREIGAWLGVNGEAIYGTRKWPQAARATTDKTLFMTRKGADLYLISTVFPTKPITLELAGVPASVRMLGSGVALKSRWKNGKYTLQPPVLAYPDVPCQYAWVFKLEGALPQ